MDIEKGKIPKGLSYALKSSVLENSLEAANIKINVHLIYDTNHVFFEAFYWLPNENIGYDRFYVRTGAVESKEARRARGFMESQVIPDFIKWANKIIRLPSNSPKLQEKPHFSRAFIYE
jgi:hypothetical protein